MSERPPVPGIDGELLDRYLAGECTEAERATVLRWRLANPDAARTLDAFLAGLDDDRSRPPAPPAAASWSALRERMRAAPAPPEPRIAPGSPRRRTPVALLALTPRRSPWRRAAPVAAGLAAVALALGAYLAGRRDEAAPPAPRIYTTTERQRADLLLSDGTRVRIAPGSRLRVHADYGAERRDVTLEGEAYFDVVHDARRPFTVYAGNASARDLGTAFSVRGYAEDNAVRVVVREGEVALSGVGRLAAGDVGRLTSDGAASVRHGANVDALLGWVDGKLAFENTPLQEVARDLARWYGVEVALADSTLGTLPFTGTLAGLPARDAVDVVAAALGLRVRREDARYVLHAVAGRTPRRVRASS